MRRAIIGSIVLSGAAMLSANVYADVNAEGVKTKWSYVGNTGPARWGQLSPAFAACDTGMTQTPINIPKKTTTIPAALKVNYAAAQLYLLDDGPTSLMIKNTQTIYNDGHTIQVNFSNYSTKESITFDNVEYRLAQFHIHTPSETLVRSESQPMEIHFVHQGKDGKVAVIAVFVKAGDASDELKKIITYMPHDHNAVHEIQGENIDPSQLLPAKQDYYSFMGSLTTPPCSGGLQWIVMANPITASPSQILKLRNVIGNNARPTQRLNGRTIHYSGA